jgi:hypothetical protein
MVQFQNAVISFIRETVASSRWDNEDAPGSAHLKEITSYAGVTEELSSSIDPEVKEFYLSVTNDIEWALNDDWLPNEVCALPLSEARCFLRDIWPIIQEHGLQSSVRKIKECHATYKNAL